MSILTLAAAAAVAATGPISGSALSTAPIGTGDYTVKIAVSQLTGTIRFGVEDSPDGTTWTPFAVFEITEPAGGEAIQEHQRSYDAPGLTTSGSNPEARVNVYKTTGTGTLTALINF